LLATTSPLLVLTLLLVGTVEPEPTDLSPTWETHVSTARQALELGELDTAGAHLEAAVSKAEAFGPYDSRLLQSLTDLGVFYFSRSAR
jgi:hypothetical protein